MTPLSEDQRDLHDRMVVVKEGIEAELLALDVVRGVGVGLRAENGVLTDELAIIVYARGGANALGGLVPKTAGGFPMVVQNSDLHAQGPDKSAEPIITDEEDTKRYNPLLGGISIAPSRLVDKPGAGTLGLIVNGNGTDNTMMLSNYHVMCLGDGHFQAGDDMCQEARSDNAFEWCGNCARLTRWFAGNVYINNRGFGIDAAVAVVTARETRVSEIMTIGPILGTDNATVGMAVQKRGRTTGLTTGMIQSVTTTVEQNFGDPVGNVLLQNQIMIAGDAGKLFSKEGDSGSVYVSTASKKVVGLHNGGTEDNVGDPVSYGGHIRPIMAALKISIPSAAQSMSDP